MNEMPIKANTECWLTNTRTGITIPAVYTGNPAFPWDIPGVYPTPSWFFMDSAGWAFDRIMEKGALTPTLTPTPTETVPTELETLKAENESLKATLDNITRYATECENTIVTAVKLILSRRAHFVKEPGDLRAIINLEVLVNRLEQIQAEEKSA